VSHETDALRGAQAREVLDNPIYRESFASIEQEIIGLWRAARDTQDREQLHQLLGLLEKVQTALESTLRTGEVATAELQRRQTRAEQMLTGLRPRAA
jgi:hypothetical protein